MKAFFRIFRYILGNLDHLRPVFVIGTFAAVGHGLIMFFIPVVVAEFLNRVVRGEGVNVWHFIGILVGLFTLLQVVQYYIRLKAELLEPVFANYLRRKYFRTILRKRTLWAQHYHSVYVLSLINRLTEHVGRFLRNWFWTLIPDVILIPLLLIVTMSQSRTAGTIVLASIVVFVGFGVYLSRRFQPIYERISRDHSKFLERFGDFMANIRTVKKLHVERFAQDSSRVDEDRLNDDFVELKRMHASRWVVLNSIYAVMEIAVLAVFVTLVSVGHAQVGIIVLLLPILERTFRVIGRTVELVITIIEANAELNVLEPMVQSDILSSQDRQLASTWNTIRVRDVAFDYTSGADQFRLAVQDETFQRGMRIGVVGRSGHGKSTFLDLVAGHYRPQQGAVTIDSIPATDLSPTFIAQTFSFIAQDAELFNMTLRENILLGADVPQDRLQDILEGTHLAALIKQLKSGLDTVVGERGVRLSLGERQRVNIARGIILNREVYLFDEVTSNVDKQTERRIFDYLFRTLAGKTIFIVSHRVENLQSMDQILIFEDGRVAARGTFDQLMASSPIFRQLLTHPTPPTAREDDAPHVPEVLVEEA
ncbi:MAG: ABC transporter ATP-binding protein [Candidatus Kerfeldbacteria bacterium]|nr:ABC transporter ATP-binding protein [Candidatus Kerfeldbacteria bacterium]